MDKPVPAVGGLRSVLEEREETPSVAVAELLMGLGQRPAVVDEPRRALACGDDRCILAAHERAEGHPKFLIEVRGVPDDPAEGGQDRLVAVMRLGQAALLLRGSSNLPDSLQHWDCVASPTLPAMDRPSPVRTE
jgi:hypothetical protein